MRILVAMIVLATAVSVGGCAERQIRQISGCNNRLASEHKREECRVCVERPRPHEYLPDNPDGMRCVPR